ILPQSSDNADATGIYPGSDFFIESQMETEPLRNPICDLNTDGKNNNPSVWKPLLNKRFRRNKKSEIQQNSGHKSKVKQKNNTHSQYGTVKNSFKQKNKHKQKGSHKKENTQDKQGLFNKTGTGKTKTINKENSSTENKNTSLKKSKCSQKSKNGLKENDSTKEICVKENKEFQNNESLEQNNPIYQSNISENRIPLSQNKSDMYWNYQRHFNPRLYQNRKHLNRDYGKAYSIPDSYDYAPSVTFSDYDYDYSCRPKHMYHSDNEITLSPYNTDQYFRCSIGQGIQNISQQIQQYYPTSQGMCHGEPHVQYQQDHNSLHQHQIKKLQKFEPCTYGQSFQGQNVSHPQEECKLDSIRPCPYSPIPQQNISCSSACKQICTPVSPFSYSNLSPAQRYSQNVSCYEAGCSYDYRSESARSLPRNYTNKKCNKPYLSSIKSEVMNHSYQRISTSSPTIPVKSLQSEHENIWQKQCAPDKSPTSPISAFRFSKKTIVSNQDKETHLLNHSNKSSSVSRSYGTSSLNRNRSSTYSNPDRRKTAHRSGQRSVSFKTPLPQREDSGSSATSGYGGSPTQNFRNSNFTDHSTK
ncbi:unnamed protein product, partial [Meganyctiphanes norvegica]